LQSQRREMLQTSRGPGSPRNSRPVLVQQGSTSPPRRAESGRPGA
jgi:hypothetical protein